MNTPNLHPHVTPELFARRVAARLDTQLSHDVSERLRAARVRAVAHRRLPLAKTAAGLHLQDGAATLHFETEKLRFTGWFAAVLPLVALLVGLVTIHVLHNDWRASELAEIDSALLTDDLPPAAYTDPGFLRFLKTPMDTSGSATPE
jgi:hypothetical protein